MDEFLKLLQKSLLIMSDMSLEETEIPELRKRDLKRFREWYISVLDSPNYQGSLIWKEWFIEFGFKTLEKLDGLEISDSDLVYPAYLLEEANLYPQDKEFLMDMTADALEHLKDSIERRV